jgi:hypothetical protein
MQHLETKAKQLLVAKSLLSTALLSTALLSTALLSTALLSTALLSIVQQSILALVLRMDPAVRRLGITKLGITDSSMLTCRMKDVQLASAMH